MPRPIVFAAVACLMVWLAVIRAGFWIAERVTGFVPWPWAGN